MALENSVTNAIFATQERSSKKKIGAVKMNLKRSSTG